LIDCTLVRCLLANNSSGQFLSDMGHGVPDALPAVPLLVAVTQFDGFFFSSRCSRRNGRSADRTTIEPNLGLNCRIAARIEDLTTDNTNDFGHL
jgi:hypothetical protein